MLAFWKLANLIFPNKREDTQENVKKPIQQFVNPFQEFNLLIGHRGIVHNLCMLDENHLATFGDDALIIIWDFRYGTKVRTLTGHKKAVRAAIYMKLKAIDKQYLITGSLDNSIKVWTLMDGCCSITMLAEGNVTFLQPLRDDLFCSNGSVNDILIWNVKGEKVAKISGKEVGELLNVISASNDRIITACYESNLIYVYNSQTFQFDKYVGELHKSYLIYMKKLDEKFLLSIDCDGLIVIWDLGQLYPIKKLQFDKQGWFTPNNPTDGNSGNNISLTNKKKRGSLDSVTNMKDPFSVTFASLVKEKYLFVAIGNKGFCVYDLKAGTLNFKNRSPHTGSINGLISMYNDQIWITCSDDSTIKFWSSPIHRESIDFLGDLTFNSHAVSHIMKLTDYSFLSVSEETLCIWKDKVVEKLRKVYFARKYLSAVRLVDHFSDQDQLTEDDYVTTGDITM